jgi:Amt family ammonium transporter
MMRPLSPNWLSGGAGGVNAYGARIVALALLATAYPLAGLYTLDRRAFVLALAASLTVLILLVRRLSPLIQTAIRLRDSTEIQDGRRTGDDAGSGDRLLADAEEVTSRLAELKHRETMRHPITNLITREPFLAKVQSELTLGAPASGVLGAVRFADYERLSAFDQDAADEALRGFAQRMQRALSGNRPLAQVDRACFAIWFCPETVSAAGAELQALTYVLGQELVGEGFQLTPEIEIGAAAYPGDGEEAAVLLARALAALTRPRAGKGEVPPFFAGAAAVTARQEFEFAQDLRRALERNEFALHYQPVVDLVEQRVVSAEALLRWQHPRLGVIGPSRFVPMLEDTELIDEIGLWTLTTACREARGWIDRGLPPVKVAVNLSARQLRDTRLPATIARALDLYRLPPHSLELELTETAAMEDADRTHAMFTALRAIGVSLAIDDFGAGYSSLSYVKKLPFDKLKIDREFVQNVDSRPDSQAICQALVALGRGLNLAVLAEGVETRAEVEVLASLGCTAFQGYYFFRPLPAVAFDTAISDQSWLIRLIGSEKAGHKLSA